MRPAARAAPAHAADLKPVVVLDWDDCLRYEKGMNYQLVHNALEIAASMHARACLNSGQRSTGCAAAWRVENSPARAIR